MTSGGAGVRWLDDHEQAAWRAYIDMSVRLSAQLNRDLQAAAGLSHADYAVLVQLSEHPKGRMRVLELARALAWEKSRLSHQLSRMQARGLVERAGCSDDKRGSYIELTPSGCRMIDDAAPAHVESVRRYLFDTMTPDQVDALGSIAQQVLAELDSACEGATDCSESAAE